MSMVADLARLDLKLLVKDLTSHGFKILVLQECNKFIIRQIIR